MDILIIDTEGFGGMDENVNHDSRIFLFSLLLSSFFIYNSVGNIDEAALNSLSLIINLAKEIQFSDKEKSEESMEKYFPSFLWIIRDFALQMVDQKGNKLTQKEYLEKALEDQKGVSESVENKNRIRKLLKHFFVDRDCYTLVRPCENEKDLQNLNKLPDEFIRKEFLAQAKSLRSKIFKKVKAKSLNNMFINGDQFVQLCKTYIEAINNDKVPNIQNAWSYICKQEAQKAAEESIQLIKDKLESSQGMLDFEQLTLLKNNVPSAPLARPHATSRAV